jgi:hypothetical protein
MQLDTTFCGNELTQKFTYLSTLTSNKKLANGFYAPFTFGHVSLIIEQVQMVF